MLTAGFAAPPTGLGVPNTAAAGFAAGGTTFFGLGVSSSSSSLPHSGLSSLSDCGTRDLRAPAIPAVGLLTAAGASSSELPPKRLVVLFGPTDGAGFLLNKSPPSESESSPNRLELGFLAALGVGCLGVDSSSSESPANRLLLAFAAGFDEEA